MRATLACHWCRKSKIKCRHDGKPPCQACTSNPGRECTLSIPRHHSKRREALRLVSRTIHQGLPDKRRLSAGSRAQEASEDVEHPETLLRDRQQLQYQPPQNVVANTLWPSSMLTGTPGSVKLQRKGPSADLENPLSNLDRDLLLKAIESFQQRFTMFSFLHGPTLLDLVHGDTPLDIKFCGILALCARFIPELAEEHGGPLAASECFASYLRHTITCHMVVNADIGMAQALLLLSFHDWGSGKGSQAWTYNGMAMRVCFTILEQLSDSRAQNHTAPNQLQIEETRRTMWACSLIEAMLGSGKRRSLGFHSSILDMPLPTSDEDFAFNTCRNDLNFLDALDLEHYDPPEIQIHAGKGFEPDFSLIIQGFNIWSTLSRWISSGGRRSESPASRKSPWRKSSFWNRSLVALENWRTSQSFRMHFSVTNSNLQAYVVRNQGSRFAFVNLIYYVATMSLHREYIPFIPLQNASPCGPSEPPVIVDTAPPGWWEESARRLFQSACDTIRLMKQLRSYGIDLPAPFTCFCVFNATTALAYARKWPNMACGESNTADLLDWGADWLSKASEVWEIARPWCATLTEVNAFYTRLQLDGHDLAIDEHQEAMHLRDKVERLAGLDTSGSQNASIEDGRRRPEGHSAGRLQDCIPVNFPQEQQITPELTASPSGFSTMQFNQSWSSTDDILLDYDFLTSALIDPSGDFLMRMC